MRRGEPEAPPTPSRGTLAFRLHKWFLDCVTDTGEAVIVYAATLRWGWLRLGYSATLTRDRPDRPAVTTTRWGRPESPRRLEAGFSFEDARLDVHGRWLGPPVDHGVTLFEGEHGRVHWHCHLPQADVELQHGGRNWRGRGYVEHLALEIAPWHLPIRVLRWGRFHAEGRSLVWIQWEGPVPLRLVLANGEAVAADPVDDGGFTLHDGRRLELGPPSVLRSGELGRTVLTRRLLRCLPLPRSIRTLEETKVLATARLLEGATEHLGTALHEVVRWR